MEIKLSNILNYIFYKEISVILPINYNVAAVQLLCIIDDIASVCIRKIPVKNIKNSLKRSHFYL
jgi:hypothetical protein